MMLLVLEHFSMSSQDKNQCFALSAVKTASGRYRSAAAAVAAVVN
jgi:hypothetical protein